MKVSLLLAVLPLAIARPSTLRRRAEPAPIIRPTGVEVVPNKYIVVLKSDGGDIDIQRSVSALNAVPEFIYNAGSFQGFSIELDDDTLAIAQDDPTVS